MPDIAEVYKAIRTAALADATLTAMLSSSTAFYYGEEIAAELTAAFIVLSQQSDSPNQSDSFWGDFRPRVQMDVVGPDPNVLHRIVGRLDQLFVIPFKRATVIETTNFVVRQMLRRDALLLPMAERESDGIVFQHIVTEWDLKVTAKS